MMAVHAGTSHQPSRLRIGDISILFQRDRNALRIDGKATGMELNAPGTAITWNCVDHAANETLGCDLVGFPRCVVDLVERIAHESTLRRALAQGGQGNGRASPIQIRDLLFGERSDLGFASETRATTLEGGHGPACPGPSC